MFCWYCYASDVSGLNRLWCDIPSYRRLLWLSCCLYGSLDGRLLYGLHYFDRLSLCYFSYALRC